MKKFKFSLEALRKVRIAREEQAVRALADSQNGLRLEIESKKSLEVRLNKSLVRRESLADGGISTTAYAVEEGFIVGTKQRLIQADQAILRAQRQVEKSMKLFLLARRQLRMVETLKEKSLEEYKKESAKRRQRDLDDQVIMRERLKQEDVV